MVFLIPPKKTRSPLFPIPPAPLPRTLLLATGPLSVAPAVLGPIVGWRRRRRAWQVGKVRGTPLPQDGCIRGRQRVHPTSTTSTKLLRGWRTFVSDKIVGPGGGLSDGEGGLNNLPERAQFRLLWRGLSKIELEFLRNSRKLQFRCFCENDKRRQIWALRTARD